MAVAWRSNPDISDLNEGQHRHPLVRGITEDMLLYARTQAGLPSLRSRKKNILTVVKKHNFQGDVLPVSSVAAKNRSEEHTSELQSLMRISYAVFCLKKKNKTKQ